MPSQLEQPSVTGQVLLEAQFDVNIIPYGRWWVALLLSITVAGIPLIPFWWIFSYWYGPEYYRRASVRLTTHALEIRKGVFARSEATIPLNRIADLRLHDGPLMRHYGLRGLKVETAGQSSGPGASKSDLLGLVDAVQFRDAVLRQRQKLIDSGAAGTDSSATGSVAGLLTAIRDILARMETGKPVPTG